MPGMTERRLSACECLDSTLDIPEMRFAGWQPAFSTCPFERNNRNFVTPFRPSADDERAILATVIDVRGSGYRLPGARMLILADGADFRHRFRRLP